MQRYPAIVCALLLSLCAGAQTIPADPDIKVGKLDNGMTYYLCHNANPAGCAEFYIAHNVGALQEEDNQNGLAHFLEHMAFNGTRHYPEKRILEFLADEGVRFGYNVNAYTAKTETVYNLSNVPLVRDSFIDSVLMVLHDWSCDINCEQKAIDDERGVISEEWRLGNDSRSRMAEQQTALIYKGSKQAERNVIGTLEVINGFKREEILDFYHKWYRPDLQAIIVVGDFDTEQMEGRIRRLFCDIPATVNPEPKGVYIPPAIEEPIFEDMTDAEVRYQAFKALYRQDNPYKDHSNESFFKDEFCRMIVTTVLADRFRERIKDKDSEIQSATMVTNSCKPDMYVSFATVVPKKKENLAGCLRFTEREVQRLLRYGISPEEFEVAKLNISDRLHLNTPLEREEIKNGEIVSMAVSNFLMGTPLILPDSLREMRRSIMSGITLEDIVPYPAMMYGQSGKIYSNCYNDVDDAGIAPTKEQMQQIIAEVDAEEIAPAFLEYPEMNMTVGEASGKILSQKKLRGTDMELWKLSNGVKVYYKESAPVKRDEHLAMQFVFDTGFKVFDPDSVTAARYALTYAKRNTGFGGVAKAEQKNYPELSGIKLMLMGNSQDARMLVTSTADKAETAFSAACLQISDPYFGEERLLESSKAASLKSMGKKKTPKDLFDERCNREIYGNHPWLQEVDSASVQTASLTTVADAFRRYYGDIASLKVIICSDIPRSEIESFVEKYIAALSDDYPYAKGKRLYFRPVAKGRMEIIDTADAVSAPFSQISWNHYFKGGRSIKERAVINILDYIMSARYLDLIREKRGGAYSVQFVTSVATDKVLPSDSYVNFRTRPELRDLLLGDLDSELERMCKEGPTAQEMERAVKYLVKHHYESQEQISRSVGSQLDQMENYIRLGTPYGYDYEKVVKSIKASDVRALARRVAAGDLVLTIYSEE
jgi:zinc protease